MGGLGALVIFYMMYPWMAARTIKNIIDLNSKEGEQNNVPAHVNKDDHDPSDAWKPKGWNMDSFYDDQDFKGN